MRNLLFIPVLLLLSAGCGNSDAGQPREAAARKSCCAGKPCATDSSVTCAQDERSGTGQYKVTFIELGSVNCVPCKMMVPVMKYVEETYAGQVNVVFHDVWTPAGKPFAQQYGIRSIPTQVFLDADGNEYYRHEGFFAQEELIKILAMKDVE